MLCWWTGPFITITLLSYPCYNFVLIFICYSSFSNLWIINIATWAFSSSLYNNYKLLWNKFLQNLLVWNRECHYLTVPQVRHHPSSLAEWFCPQGLSRKSSQGSTWAEKSFLNSLKWELVGVCSLWPVEQGPQSLTIWACYRLFTYREDVTVSKLAFPEKWRERERQREIKNLRESIQ